MSAPELRPYQVEVIEQIRAEIAAGRRRILLVAPTGSGKTVIASAIIAKTLARDHRALFLAHRRELVGQASHKLHDAGIDAGMILPGYPMRLEEPAQVASIASLHARAIRTSARQLAECMDRPPLVGDIVSHWHRLGQRRRTVVFATSVAHSLHLRDEFRRSGVLAEHLDGSTPIEERDAILADLAAGKVEVVTNCAVLTEGFDCPDIGCLVLARPTKSLGLHRQMVGRALRPAPGKADALILDHAGNTFRHGFPDDEIKWTLETGQRAQNLTQLARGSHGRQSLTNCPECSAVRLQGKPCPVCGWRPRSKPEGVEVAEGELGRIGRDRTVVVNISDEERRRFYRQLLYIAMQRGYARGWANHKYRERFGSWPKFRNTEPMPPDEATRAWVRHRTIAFARAAEKRGAA